MKQNDEIYILLEALKYFYPVYFGEDPHPIKSFFDYKGRKYSKDWVLSETFRISQVPKKNSDIGVAIRELEKIAGSKFIEPPEKVVESTVPEKGTSEIQEEIRKQRGEGKIKADIKGVEFTQEFINKQKARVERLKGLRVIVAKKDDSLQKVKLSEEDKKKLYTLGINAKKDPYTTEKTIEDAISKAVKTSPNKEIREGIPETTIAKTTTKFVENVKQYGNFESPEEIPSEMPAAINQRSILETITNPNDENFKKIITDGETRKIIAQNAQILSTAIETDRNINSSLVEPVIGSESIVRLFYGYPDVEKYELLTEDEEKERNDGVEIRIDELSRTAEDVRSVWERFSSKGAVATETTEAVSLLPRYSITTTPEISAGVSSSVAGSLVAGGTVAGFGWGALQSAWSTQYLLPASISGYLGSGLPGTEMLGVYTTTSNAIVSSSAFNFSMGNFSLGIATVSTPTRGIFAARAAFGQKAIQLLAVQTGSKITIGLGTATLGEAAGTAATTAITTTGAAAGTGAGILIGQITIPIPFVGAAIGALSGWVASKIPWGKVKKFGLAFVGIPIAVGGFLIGSAPLTMGGLGLTGVGLFSGMGITAAGVLTGAYQILGAVAGATLGAIGGPILGFLLGFPLVVALILFIINSGAYVVPPSISLLGSENPYIDIAKTSDPAGPFENSDLPKIVTYTITITAKQQALTNVAVKDECTVISEAGSRDCPAPDIVVPGGTISGGSPFVFTYTANFDKSYEDSLVVNTVTVTADTEEGGDPQTATGGLSITIGKPPTDCLKIDGAWPASYKANMESAVGTLASKYSNYLSKVCLSRPEIPLRFSPGGMGGLWGWNAGSYINFFPLGLGKPVDALYILAHELGHSLASGSQTAHIHARYTAYPGIKSEAPYCFYAATASWNEDESLPESIALTVIEPYCGSVQSRWPRHATFLRTYVFN